MKPHLFPLLAFLLLATSLRATDRIAASASTADVQTAVNAAVDGDRVLIPNSGGAVSWTSGITTSKQIIIQAQNYTPTPAGTSGAGATTRNVTITNNSGSALFAFTTGNTSNVGIGGIRFNEGSGNGPDVSFAGTGNKVPFIFDCYFENKSRFFPAETAILITCRGGIMWNCYIKGTFDVNSVGESVMKIKIPGNSWATASTMGTLDTGGITNFYIEDTTFKDAGLIDMDDSARMVVRHSIFDGSWAETHGFTSIWGGRWWEFYDMTWQSTSASRNLARRYFWCRAGSGIFTNCVVNNATDSQAYGSVTLLNIGDNTSPSGSYLIPRQPGCGHNGSTFVSDPIYIWNNTGTQAYTWNFNDDPGGWQAVVVQNRDVFVNNGAKPGYTKFQYPHPLRFDIGPDTTPPTLVSATIAPAGNSIALVFNETVRVGTGGSGGFGTTLTGGASVMSGASVSGSTITYSLSRVVQSSETGTLAYIQPVNGIEDSTGNDLANFSGTAIINNSTQGADTTPPTSSTRTISTNGTTWTLTFNEPVRIGAGGSGGFSVNASGGAVTLSGLSASGSTITATGNRTVQTGETVTLSYTQPGNGVEDSPAGNDLASFVALAVTNQSTQPGGGNTYYVDQTAGNDASAGTQAAPWKNCPGMAGTSAHTGAHTLAAGDTVYFDKADTWLVSAPTGGNGGLSIVGGVSYIGNVFNPSSSPSARATIRANGRCEASGIRWNQDSASTVTLFEGFVVDGNGNRGNGIGLNHPFYQNALTGAMKRIKNCVIQGWTGDGSAGDFYYGIMISDNSSDLSGTVSNVEILDTTVTSAPRDGIAIYPGPPGRVSNILVRGCTVSGNRTDPSYAEGHGIVTKGDVRNATIEYNYVASTINAAALFINGPESGTASGPTNCIYRFNILSSSQDDGTIRFFGTGNKTGDVYGNIVMGTSSSGGFNLSGSSGTMTLNCYNNTFLTFVDIGDPSATGTLNFRNNIISSGASTPFTDSGQDVDTHSNNIYFRTSGGTTLVTSGASTFTAGNLSSYETSGISTNPNFVNSGNPPTGFTGTYPTFTPNTTGLSLAAGSPGINGGVDLGATFNGSVNSVTRTAPWDIGAYEFSGAVGDTTPPTLLTRTIGTNGTTWTLVFDEPVSIGTGGSGGWTATMTSGAVTLSGFTLGGNTLTATGSRSVGAGETGTLSYVQPGNGVEDNPAGNDFLSIAGQSVTNNSVQDITPPTPNPMSFSTVPAATAGNSITMTATLATDATSAVQYLFDETSGNSGGTDSGWQTSRTYTDTGLLPGVNYSYMVQARDAAGNTTAFSQEFSARTPFIPGAYKVEPSNVSRSGMVTP
jgi:uncharacterized repeat protein (TIGR02059 family)